MQERINPEQIKEFIKKCRRNKLRVTPQRTAIYGILLRLKTHPSADVVYRQIKPQFPNISFDTVNRTLLTFARVGIIDVVEGHGDPRRFDLNVDNHHHFYCMSCGDIIDLYNEAYDQLPVPKEIPERFTVTSKRVVLRGVCKTCGESRIRSN